MTQAYVAPDVTDSTLPIDDLGATALDLEMTEPVEVLRWAVERYGPRFAAEEDRAACH